MFKHHRHSVEVHDVGGSSTFNNAPYAPSSAPAAAAAVAGQAMRDLDDRLTDDGRGEMLRKYQAENNGKADKLRQSELAASLARTGQEVLADPFNFDLTTARFLGEEGKDNYDRLAPRR